MQLINKRYIYFILIIFMLYNLHGGCRDAIAEDVRLNLHENQSTPAQIGKAAREYIKNAPKSVQGITITPIMLGLKGMSLQITCASIEKSKQNKKDNDTISAEEIWNATEFTPPSKPHEWKRTDPFQKTLMLSLETRMSFHEKLNENAQGTKAAMLHETSLFAGGRLSPFLNFLTISGGVRLKASSNLETVTNYIATPSIHRNNDALTLDHLSLSATHSFSPSLHGLVSAGHLDQEFFGGGGEVLYRPFASRLAIGAQGWLAYNRNPQTAMNIGIFNSPRASALINGWYALPKGNITLNAAAGRFLGGDWGTKFGLTKHFKSGANIGAKITITNDNPDYFELRLAMPLNKAAEKIKYIPARSTINNTLNSTLNAEISPFFNQSGKAIKQPLSLYEITERLSLSHISDHWEDIME